MRCWQRAREIIEEKNPELPNPRRRPKSPSKSASARSSTRCWRGTTTKWSFSISTRRSPSMVMPRRISSTPMRAPAEFSKMPMESRDGREFSCARELQLDFGRFRRQSWRCCSRSRRCRKRSSEPPNNTGRLLIANYVYELAKAFNDFYHACPVIQSEEPVRARDWPGRCDPPGAGERSVAAGHRSAERDVSGQRARS